MPPDPLNALNNGIVGDGVTDNTAALAAFLSKVGSKTAYFPEGVYIGSIALNGLKCQIKGDGSGTIFKAPPGSTHPTIDMTGYIGAFQGYSNRVFSNFAVEHDGTEGTTKKGILAPNLSTIIFRNVSIKNTGGAALDISGTQLSTFENVTLATPVNAKTNDTPYLYAQGATNGNRFTGLGLRSVSSSGDVGVSGAVVFANDSTQCPNFNAFYSAWVEFLHPPTNGTIFSHKGSTALFADTQWFDCSKEVGATGTSCFRFAPATAPGAGGGNEVRGLIPGKGTNLLDFDCGVDIRQSGNRVVGVKGYKGTNVILAPGVQHTYVELGGAEGSCTDAAVVDNSGNNTNVVVDHYLGI